MIETCSYCGHNGHRASSCPRRRGTWIAMAALAFGLSGCAELQKAVPELAVVDTYCLNAQKRLWSINDSPQSIHDAQVYNATVDKRCGGKNKS